MNNALILTHPAFDRPAVLNAKRHGPTPRGIPMLRRERWKRRSELGVLYKWAREHGIEPNGGNGASFYDTFCGAYDYDKLRKLKAKDEARNEPTSAEKITEYEATLNDVARMLLYAAQAISALREKQQSRN